MVENWLDPKALSLINGGENVLKKKVITISSSESDEDAVIQIDEKPKVNYDDSKIEIQLPGSNKKEKLHYVFPQLPKKNDVTIQTITEPDFKRPAEYFDIFEHFQYSWIDAPELEK